MGTAFTDTYVRNLKSVGRYTDIATQVQHVQVNGQAVIGNLGR